jgi:hypothetical protein
MRDCNRWSVTQHLDWFRRQFAQFGKLPFSGVLRESTILKCLQNTGVTFYASLYSPVAVVWLFLSQVIHANPTLAVVVESFLAWRLGQGLPACSVNTGAYSRARQRLPESLLAALTRHTGLQTEQAAANDWRWLGRVVKLFDGSTVSMPDTPENQAAYPQNRSQKPGVGFPIARIGVLFSLTVGAVLDVGLRRWTGKFQSELAMFRDMFSMFNSGDVVLTDRYLCSYMEIALLRSQGVDFVGRIHTARKVDFRTGQRLGPSDHLVYWSKPRRPEWMSPEQYALLPNTMCIREFRQRIVRKGYRTRTIVIATTLVDAELYPCEEIAKLYRLRWDAEINLRHLKTTMKMDVLRGKTPEMVRKEIWAHLLAYNLIRTVMAQSALKHGKHPRHLSFTRAMRTLEAFRNVLAFAHGERLLILYQQMFRAIASHEIANRPDRLEPRQRKRRPKPYKLMTEPRNQARKLYAKKR